ncbi:MAG: S-adenosylhomocysteine deaminase [Deltaproteobacteria bacterium]|nr:amidohydrolase [Deltaproteobacteria bacterium]MBW2076824.1 amidohydrolase [Deltaproteobacteria bacterium]MBW2309683.1 amidohydrolase [Deltaproteobacteria bacterium]RLB29997.1 MAG: S-adenosylhomocysteine deaminase [Deltaproteobacteria bacterium]
MSRADITIRNGTILTMDQENRIIPNGTLAISGDTIRFVGSNGEASMDAGKILDAEGGLILPGLINSHTHAAMTLFRGLADDLPLMDWLNEYIFPVESKMDAEFVRVGTLLACAEMIMSGTTTFCDMYLFEHEVARAAREAGMRCLVGEVLYDFPSPNYGPIEQGLRYTERLIQTWGDDPLVSIAVEPHSLYTCSPDLLKAANTLALDYHVPLIIHIAETLSEIAEVRKRYGKRPLEHLQALGVLGPNLIADHCVHLDEWDIETIAQHKAKAVDNPESNMKLASGISPVPEMLAAGVTVGLGTDGCASNNNLDLFEEMDMAAKAHKIKNLDPTVMNALTVVRMATIEGAKVLGIDAVTGSLEVGKKADIIVLDTDKPHLTPMYNPFSHLVYAARGHDVRHTIINGTIVMEDRSLRTLDTTEIMARAAEKSVKVREWVGI